VPDEDEETKELQRFTDRMEVLVQKTYTGLLTTPLEPAESWLPISARWGELSAEDNPVGARFMALFAHYEIDPKREEAWFQLAVCLSLVHVPAFRIAPIQGRRQTQARDDIKLIMLVHTVQRRFGQKTESAALRRLLERKIYTDSFETLKRRYIRAKKRYARQMPSIMERANAVIEEEINARKADDAAYPNPNGSPRDNSI
jgi:hypothetical protein